VKTSNLKLRNMDTRFRKWNVRRVYRAGSLTTGAERVSEFKLELMGVQDVRREGGGTEPAGENTFFYGNWNDNYELRASFLVHKRIISAITRINFVSDRMSYTFYRGRWCHTVLNVNAPTVARSFPVQMGLKHRDSLSTMLSKFTMPLGRYRKTR
jgi:hypothetical protein